jgi:hypothetical protein
MAMQLLSYAQKWRWRDKVQTTFGWKRDPGVPLQECATTCVGVCTIITITMVLYAPLSLSLWYCMHNYYYDIVCMQNYDIIPLVRFCDVLYINLCIDHAKIFINLPPGNHKNIFVLSALNVGLPLKPTGYRSLPSGLPNETD